MNRESRDVTVRGVRIRATTAGSEKAPPLLLVHGFLLSAAAWDDVIARFAEEYFVVAPDLPGFGGSEKPSPARFAYGIEAFAEALADLLAAFGLGRVHVVGHAMGGAVALTLAAAHSELVERLVVVDPLVYPFPMRFRLRLPHYPVIGPLMFKQLYGRSLFRAHFREDVIGAGSPMNLARVDGHYDRFNTPAARESAYATMRAILDTRPIVARLGRIRCPTLVVWGRDDRILPATHAPRLVKDLGDARLAIFDTGHSPHEEAPEAFAASVLEFLGGRR